LEGVEQALNAASVLVDERLDEEAVLKRYQEELTGHPAIHVCYILLTDQCNLRCSYCFIQNSLPRGYHRSSMTPAIASDAVDFFHRAALRAQALHPHTEGEYTLLFYGGEPCLNDQAFRAALNRASVLAFPGSVKLAVVTNGTCLNPETADMLKDHNVGVSVSLDGPADITDHFRNKGTYQRALAGLQQLRNAGINPGISCTIPPSSLCRFSEIQDWLLDLGVRNVGFNLVTRPAGRHNSSDYYREATKLLLRAFERFRERGIFEDRIMRKVRAFVEAKPYPFDCAACGGAQIVVAPDGRVGICHALLGEGKTFVGTIYDATFIPEDHLLWKEWSRRSPLNMPECKACPCLGICGGGCPVNSTEDIWSLDGGFCAHAKVILQWLIDDLFRHEVTFRSGHPLSSTPPV
jgi:uncharacterized protein